MRIVPAIFVLVLLSPNAFAMGGCLCAGAPTAQEAFAASDAVFAGVIEKIDDPEGDRIRALPQNEQGPARRSAEKSGTFGRLVTFRVFKWWKGKDTPQEVQLRISADDTECAFHPTKGHAYLVYSKRDPLSGNELLLSLCSRTWHLVCGREDMATFGAPIKVHEEYDVAKLIAREQPYLNAQCLKPARLIGERPLVPQQCYWTVDAVIDETGAVRDLEELSVNTGCPLIEPNIIRAWKFRPATIDGIPVQTRLRAISAREPFSVADEERWKAEEEARQRAREKPQTKKKPLLGISRDDGP